MSCVSHFEAANFLSDSPSEGTPFVPEKFAFQQVKGMAAQLSFMKGRRIVG